jgi:hypothetical protein
MTTPKSPPRIRLDVAGMKTDCCDQPACDLGAQILNTQVRKGSLQVMHGLLFGGSGTGV